MTTSPTNDATLPPPQITFAELERMMRDPAVPDAEVRKYLRGDKRSASPFSPGLAVNPDLVIMDENEQIRVRGKMAMSWANGTSRIKRQARFNLRKTFGEGLPVVVAEGDSWFQFPIALDDVVDQLDPDYLVWCVSAAGDTLQNMVFDAPEYIDAIRSNGPPKVFLFSGAGNDIVGEDETDNVSYLAKCVRRFDPAFSAKDYIDTYAFRERLAFVERAYKTLFTGVHDAFGSGVKIVCHGYDHAIPHAGEADPRRPYWAASDGWLAGPLRSQGILQHTLQRQIVALMIDALNEVQRRLCGGNNAGGTFKSAYHVDLRGTLTRASDWADELHPTDEGFKAVAAKMRPLIKTLAS